MRLRGNQALNPHLRLLLSTVHRTVGVPGGGWGLKNSSLLCIEVLWGLKSYSSLWELGQPEHPAPSRVILAAWAPLPDLGETLIAPCCKGPLKANTKQGAQAVDGVSNSSGSPQRGKMSVCLHLLGGPGPAEVRNDNKS